MDEHQNQVTICVAGDGIVFFKSKSEKQTYRVKVIPLDLRNAPVSLKQICKVKKKKRFSEQRRNSEGKRCSRNHDFELF